MQSQEFSLEANQISALEMYPTPPPRHMPYHAATVDRHIAGCVCELCLRLTIGGRLFLLLVPIYDKDSLRTRRGRDTPFAKFRLKPTKKSSTTSHDATVAFYPISARRKKSVRERIHIPWPCNQPILVGRSSTDKSTKSVGSAKMHVMCRADYRRDTHRKCNAGPFPLIRRSWGECSAVGCRKLTIFASLLGWYREGRGCGRSER